jgi:hypothetical protein
MNYCKLRAADLVWQALEQPCAVTTAIELTEF